MILFFQVNKSGQKINILFQQLLRKHRNVLAASEFIPFFIGTRIYVLVTYDCTRTALLDYKIVLFLYLFFTKLKISEIKKLTGGIQNMKN
jgi:hypothetical protein